MYVLCKYFVHITMFSWSSYHVYGGIKVKVKVTIVQYSFKACNFSQQQHTNILFPQIHVRWKQNPHFSVMLEFHSISLVLGEVFLTHVEMAVIAGCYTPQTVWLGGCDVHFYAHTAVHRVGTPRAPTAVDPILSSHPFYSIARCVHTAKKNPRI